MICRRCHTDNPDSAHYCQKCGAHLAKRPAAARKSLPWYIILAGGLVLLTAGFFLSRAVFKSPGLEAVRSVQPAEETSPPVSASGREQPGPAAGFVSPRGAEGDEKSRWTTAVLDGAWVALPAWVLLDRGDLEYTGGASEPVPVEWAVWSEREPVVLFRLDAETGGRSPRLAAFRPDVPLLWKSLGQDGTSFVIGPISPARNGSFLHFDLPEEIRQAGLFAQEETVVGWTFGPTAERGYLWAGTRDVELAPRTKANELAGSVFSGSREARFARVLAVEDKLPPVEQLRGFVEAFRSDPVLEAEDAPPSLRPESVLGRMHALALELIQAGAAADVVRALGDSILIQTASPALIMDAALAWAKSRSYESAVEELTRLEKRLFETKGVRPAELSAFEARLYKDWLRQTIDGRRSGGLEAFEKAKLAFPNDVEIHLLGVEVAILEKNWARATEFLQMREYPSLVADRVKMLESLIQEGQKDEGVAILRFDPGADHIPVQAFVNGKLFMNFIIDTGANTSSIPLSAVESLGLKIDDSTKAIVIEGVTGRGITYEVTLDSVELAGQRVFNVKASLIDMRSYPDTGLLGQNFLNNFRLDIDYKKGILRIKKR
jgi:clan AA aspartic protease (TIGR02281 family)